MTPSFLKPYWLTADGTPIGKESNWSKCPLCSGTITREVLLYSCSYMTCLKCSHEFVDQIGA